MAARAGLGNVGSCMSVRARVLLLGLFVVFCAGCTFHPDPTELNFYVTVRNDLGRTIRVSYCATGDAPCRGKLYGTLVVRQGAKYGPTQTSVGTLNSLAIDAPNGQRLGCIPLYFDYNADGSVLAASTMVACARDYPIKHQPSNG